jgi:hypothetical protein
MLTLEGHSFRLNDEQAVLQKSNQNIFTYCGCFDLYQ